MATTSHVRTSGSRGARQVGPVPGHRQGRDTGRCRSGSPRGKDALRDEIPPELDAMRKIHLQDPDGGPALRRQPREHRPLPPEMTRPLMTARVEQGDDLPALRVDAGDVRPLVTVAREAA